MTERELDWCCIAAVNSRQILENNLKASPVFQKKPEKLTIVENAKSASMAYNIGLSLTSSSYCVFAHQDVYLPDEWESKLNAAIRKLEEKHKNWAVAGLFGVSVDGCEVGNVWSSGLSRELGMTFDDPIPVQSLDELLIISKRQAGLRFDSDLPGFHLYGTDIVQQALLIGHGAYVVHAPVIHNSKPVATLFGPYMLAYRYMARKWKKELPLRNLICDIRGTSAKLYLTALRLSIRRALNSPAIIEESDPKQIAIDLGYERKTMSV